MTNILTEHKCRWRRTGLTKATASPQQQNLLRLPTPCHMGTGTAEGERNIPERAQAPQQQAGDRAARKESHPRGGHGSPQSRRLVGHAAPHPLGQDPQHGPRGARRPGRHRRLHGPDEQHRVTAGSPGQQAAPDIPATDRGYAGASHRLTPGDVQR